MEWWIWILLGLLLFLAELVTSGGFYFMFFGIGAVVVGVLAGFGAAGPLWFQFILFSILALVTLWLFREKLLQLTEGVALQNVDSLVGETAVASDQIAVNGIGKAEMRGTSWSARNIGDQPLKRGERAKVERVEGLTLIVRPEGN
ncbi:MAG TPA: NfeD family protein [Candidatus Binatia bacterium]|jgi:membrane protein implicated in regulation of membrane protease activity|nr:NfeD family protein [Candidatus Binatia bacterium]